MKPVIVHVNRHTITKNKKNKANDPAIAVRRSRSAKADYSRTVDILDQDGNVVATIGSHLDNPLPCGATIYIECYHGVRSHNETLHDGESGSISGGTEGQA